MAGFAGGEPRVSVEEMPCALSYEARRAGGDLQLGRIEDREVHAIFAPLREVEPPPPHGIPPYDPFPDRRA